MPHADMCRMATRANYSLKSTMPSHSHRSNLSSIARGTLSCASRARAERLRTLVWAFKNEEMLLISRYVPSPVSPRSGQYPLHCTCHIVILSL
jgi:hypothetical protein